MGQGYGERSWRRWESTWNRSSSMIMRNLLLVSLSFLCLEACHRCEAVSELPRGQELEALLDAAMEIAVGSSGVPDMEIWQSSKELIVARDSALPHFEVPGFDNVVELDAAQIRQRAEEMGRFMYLGVSCCELEGRLVTIAVYTAWSAPARDNTIILSGGSVEMKFCRHQGKWLLDSSYHWIS